jgi:hypothetical protein
MKQSPLFRRQFFIQNTANGLPTTESGGEVLYLRLQGHAANPGQVLGEQRLFLGAGGVLDVVSERNGGDGMGRIAYTPGLFAAIKRGEEHTTYRFQIPDNASPGTKYQVTVYGHDRIAPFRFAIEVGRR